MPAEYRRKFCCEIMTAQGQVAAMDAVSVHFPAEDGMVGILAGRSPLVAALGTGKLTVFGEGGDEADFFVSGGFVQVCENAVSVLADYCRAAEALSIVEAQRRVEQAMAMPTANSEQRQQRRGALDVARKQYKMAQEVLERRRIAQSVAAGEPLGPRE